MKALILLAICAMPWCGPAVLAGSEALPEPDYAAISRRAQRADPGQSYIAGMPGRHKECDDTATPYFDAGVTASMAQGGYIRTTCHVAMLNKLAELHYRPNAFGSGDMPALMDRLPVHLTRLYQGIYGPKRCLHECGSMGFLSAIAQRSSEIERAVEIMALLHVPPPEREKWLEAWNRAGWLK
jgi:hypothetical protein